ncbi:hypothetical protein F5X68DRAFT_186676 [Plectosphaerella plurivora]|uniref:DUF6546 domain-containing protein n=1 Tax=Plectosphaerella plurivora TaxID=936078 RepID=A0A9P9AEK1_9PEZI|nr:hypothetical protein F5X68DRAFT_186676 [Plectosphaerella plurivora]
MSDIMPGMEPGSIFNFNMLPPETRHQIMQSILLVIDESPRGETSLTNLVMVCREWRHFFEPFNFSTITLDNIRVQEMAFMFAIEPYRVRHVRSIRLRVFLDQAIPEAPENMKSKPDMVFMKAVKELFDVLSQWDENQNKGIILELLATCDGDRDALVRFRTKKYQALQLSQYLDQFIPSEQLPTIAASVEALNSAITQLIFPIKDYTTTVLPIPAGANTPYGFLPAVPVVKTFAILRHTTHIIGPNLMRLIFEHSLTSVQSILHEKWRQLTPTEKQFWGMQYREFLRVLPSTLTCLTIFDEVHGELHIKKCGFLKDIQLGRCIALSTQNLQNMSLSFVVDSEDFFPDRQSQTIDMFPNLKTLVLTNGTIRPNAQLQVLMAALSRYAEKIIHGMPALRVYEIWNAGTKFGGVFQYKFDGESTVTIRHKTTWRTQPMDGTFNVWRNILVNMEPPRTLDASMVKVPAPAHYLDFLPELELAANIMAGISRQNAANEAFIRELPVPYYNRH